MSESKVTSKGQITIPVRVRSALGIDAGDRVEFVEIEKGRFLIAGQQSCAKAEGPDTQAGQARLNRRDEFRDRQAHDHAAYG